MLIVLKDIGAICLETVNKVRDSFTWTTPHTKGKTKNKCSELPDDSKFTWFVQIKLTKTCIVSNWTSDDVTIWLKNINLRHDSLVALIDNDFKGTDLLGKLFYLLSNLASNLEHSRFFVYFHQRHSCVWEQKIYLVLSFQAK